MSLVAGLDRLLPTYARTDLTVVRGEGCRVWDDAGAFEGGIVPKLLAGVRAARLGLHVEIGETAVVA